MMLAVDVPTSRAQPVAIPSGRSVFSRRTSSGTPSAGASSCIPPESLSTRSRIAQPREQLAVAARGEQRNAGHAAEQRSHLVVATCGLG